MANENVAPFPDELLDLVEKCAYRPGWWVRLHEDYDRGQGSRGTTLVITTLTLDSYNPDPKESIRVNHLFPVPPAAFDRRSWQWWLFSQFLLVEQHECMEFFQIDGERVYAPMHGPGNDPYLITIERTAIDRRTNFRGEIEDDGGVEASAGAPETAGA